MSRTERRHAIRQAPQLLYLSIAGIAAQASQPSVKLKSAVQRSELIAMRCVGPDRPK